MAKEIKRLEPIVKKIEALEEEYKQLQAKTPEFQERYKNGESLDDLLPEAFCHLPGGCRPGAGHAALPGAAHGRHHPAPGADRRNENR